MEARDKHLRRDYMTTDSPVFLCVCGTTLSTQIRHDAYLIRYLKQQRIDRHFQSKRHQAAGMGIPMTR